MQYIHLLPPTPLPEVPTSDPFKAIIVAEMPVGGDVRAALSEWLVQSHCLYMMAWGEDCKAWAESVDHACMAAHSFGKIPDAHFVMTTCHEKEPIEEVFWFSSNCAIHPVIELSETVIIHLAEQEREAKISKAFSAS